VAYPIEKAEKAEKRSWASGFKDKRSNGKIDRRQNFKRKRKNSASRKCCMSLRMAQVSVTKANTLSHKTKGKSVTKKDSAKAQTGARQKNPLPEQHQKRPGLDQKLLPHRNIWLLSIKGPTN
jgi:hypothetical protein